MMDFMRVKVAGALMILFIIINYVGAVTDPNDASALKGMFTSLNAPVQLTRWTSDGDDPCGQQWMGVTCSGSRVTEIILPSEGLTGSMGYQLESLSELKILDISHNNLGGNIPYQLPPNAEHLDFSYNQFVGGIPYSISDMVHLVSLNLSHNQLQTQLNDIFGHLSSLTALDVSFDSLTGNLPQSLSALTSMKTMYLQNNQLTGSINVLGNLPLENLNVENNLFTGWVPQQFKGINLQVGGNNWNFGPAPPPPPGVPPAPKAATHKTSPNNATSGNSSHGSSKKSGIGGGGIAGIVLSLLLVGAVVVFILVKRWSRSGSFSDPEKPDAQSFTLLAPKDDQVGKSVQIPSSMDTKTVDFPPAMSLRPPPLLAKRDVRTPMNVKAYSIADLQVATGSFHSDNLLGTGSFGHVYKALLIDDKVPLAVKKIESTMLPGDITKNFMEMVSKICMLKHPNVTELVGYCSEHGQNLLVYQFHDNGSLYDYLHAPDEDTIPLTWNARVMIALGIARALEYLHETNFPSIVHMNIKSSNILLDKNLNPYLSDSGLACFLLKSDQELSYNVGSGYNAPEIVSSGASSPKSDVYGFGVVMLELLTGRMPFDSSRPRPEQSLVQWASPQLHDFNALSSMVDPGLNGECPSKSLSRFVDVIALCVQPEPEFRPPMSEVVGKLVVLVQRANLSKRNLGNEQGTQPQVDTIIDS